MFISIASLFSGFQYCACLWLIVLTCAFKQMVCCISFWKLNSRCILLGGSYTVVYTNSISYCLLRSCGLVHARFFGFRGAWWRDSAYPHGSRLRTLAGGLLRWKVSPRETSHKSPYPDRQRAGCFVGRVSLKLSWKTLGVQSCCFKGSRLSKLIHVQMGEAIHFFFFDATHISVLVAGAQAHSVIQRKSVQMDSPEGIA